MENVLFQTSLIAAFVAGMVALFAPCCITFLLPAYLGSVFKEKEKVILMTLVFGLGIFVVLLPAVLGVAFVSKLLFRYHDAIYIFGGLLMLVVAVTTFLGIKLPMPNLNRFNVGNRTDVVSIFTLGMVSGITSACCAPVLIGIMTLTLLSPSFFGALLVGGMYVLGMVVPLLLMAVFLSGKMPKMTFLRKPIATLNFFGKSYVVIVSNAVASIIFLITGFLALGLTFTGKLSAENMDVFTKTITNALSSVNGMLGNNIFINILFVGVLVGFIYWVSKKV
ncbi:MAG: cytochrome c biogenesis protein CcdA [Candidatus Daviesbacteria bacterium]|nr:cytochrome c biogenesis protein CcdA [Candidatus Daviesbacteria bacterium]